MLRFVVGVYEAELKKIMPVEDFAELVEHTAKEAFFNMADQMPTDFRGFVMDNFDAITSMSDEEYQNFLNTLDEQQ